MADRQLDLWINERWYAALEKHFGGEDVLQQKLENMLDDFINVLPDHVCAQISREIQEDQRQTEIDREARRRFAVFHITESGGEKYLLAEKDLEILDAALLLRRHLRSGNDQAGAFAQAIPNHGIISKEDYDQFVNERLDNTGRVTGAFEIDLDKGIFSALHIMDGWKTFRTQDVSTAAYQATRARSLSWDAQFSRFLEQLDGKEITPDHCLSVEQITFGDEIMEMDGRLNFYVATDFDPDHAFGTNVCTDQNDDWVNVYANYDVARGQICDALEVDLCRGDGTEKTMLYPLFPTEKKVLVEKMEAFCQEQTGQSLKDFCAQLQAEDMAPPTGQAMG